MATLSSRIHDLTAAIVTALNARASQAPASGYDIAKVNGYTGTQAQWLADFSDPGNTDYAAQFNAAIGSSIPATAVASETAAGITQLGSLADAYAGLSSAKALSVLRHANVHVAASLADLNTKAATLPPGSLVGLAQQDYSAAGNGYMYRSLWFIDHLQRATPYTPIIATVPATLTYLVSVSGTGKTFTSLYLDAGTTEALVPLTGSTTTFRMPYSFNGTAFVIGSTPRTAAMAYATAQQAYPNASLTTLSTVNVVSDPTGYMAPQAGDGSTWRMPWVGRYRVSTHMTLLTTVTAGNYYGIGCVIPGGLSLADIGSRQLQTANDGFSFTVAFWNSVANRSLNVGFYHQTGTTNYSSTGGSYSTEDPKNTRVQLEFLGG